LEVSPARRATLPERQRVKKEYRENRVYKYMHICLCTTLTIRFLEVSPARRATLPERQRVKKEYRVKSKIRKLVNRGFRRLRGFGWLGVLGKIIS